MDMDGVRKLLPCLSASLHKGSCGKIGIVGGSVQYSGAPFFSGLAMLRVGVDIAHVFAPPEVAIVIKTYSPDLIVHPSQEPGYVEEHLARLHALVIGPGLGRSPSAAHLVPRVLAAAAKHRLPTVVDGDGLFALTEKWPEIIHSHSDAVLTPNAAELDRLAFKVLEKHTLNASAKESEATVSELAPKLGMAILVKGPRDHFYDVDGSHVEMDSPGSLRRPGGIGDLLSGILTAFLVWARWTGEEGAKRLAVSAASSFVREACRLTELEMGRGMLASDVIHRIAPLLRQIEQHPSSSQKL